MFKIQIEVNGTNIAVESATTLNMGGLNAFIDSLGNKEEWVVSPKSTATKKVFEWNHVSVSKKPTPVKRGRGRPAGAKNKRK